MKKTTPWRRLVDILRGSWSKLRLASKIASLMTLLVMLAVFALSYLSIERERANFQRELVSKADLFLEASSLTLRDPLYRLELDELRDLANAVSDNEDVVSFIVYDRNGKLLVDSTQIELEFSQETDPLGNRLIAQPPNDVYLEWRADRLVAGRVVVLGNQVIGAVSTALSTTSLDRKITEITWQGVGLGLLTLLAGMGLTLLFARQITSPISDLAAAVARMSEGDFSFRVQPETQDEIGRLGEAFNYMSAGLQEREWLRDMFGRFVSKEVAEAIRGGQVRLEGENRVVSVLFCDIRGFTAFSERHTPQEVVTLLNEYLPLVVQAAQRHGGMVNKFGGDSTLIIYGAPREMEDSAYRAVLTALEIREGLARLNDTISRQGEEPLRIGVGINTGLALAGAVGPHERQEYTVIGNTVNLAARIDGLNRQFPGHDILISGWTYEALGIHVWELEMKSLGVVEIRGKHEPVQIWSVLGKKPNSPGKQATSFPE